MYTYLEKLVRSSGCKKGLLGLEHHRQYRQGFKQFIKNKLTSSLTLQERISHFSLQ